MSADSSVLALASSHTLSVFRRFCGLGAGRVSGGFNACYRLADLDIGEYDMSDVIQRSMLSALAVTCAVSMGIAPRPAAAQPVASSGPEFPSDEAYLRLLTPGNETYRTLDGHRMKRLLGRTGDT